MRHTHAIDWTIQRPEYLGGKLYRCICGAERGEKAFLWMDERELEPPETRARSAAALGVSVEEFLARQTRVALPFDINDRSAPTVRSMTDAERLVISRRPMRTPFLREVKRD